MDWWIGWTSDLIRELRGKLMGAYSPEHVIGPLWKENMLSPKMVSHVIGDRLWTVASHAPVAQLLCCFYWQREHIGIRLMSSWLDRSWSAFMEETEATTWAAGSSKQPTGEDWLLWTTFYGTCATKCHPAEELWHSLNWCCLEIFQK